MASINSYDETAVEGVESLTITDIAGDPATFTIYDIRGNEIASGPVSGSSVTIPGPHDAWPPGWFLCLFRSEAWSSATGFVCDSLQVSILRSGIANLPPVPPNGTYPNADGGSGNDNNVDQYLHGFTGMGPQRWQIFNVADLTETGGVIGGTLADIAASITLDSEAAGQTNPTYADPSRPRPEFVMMPNNRDGDSGFAAGVTAVVSALSAQGVMLYEGLNEPSGSNGLSQTQSGENYNAFRAAVKAGNPAALAMGPAEVAFAPDGSSTGSAAITEFLAAVTPGTLDVFSVHDYESYNGDFLVLDASLACIRQALASAGYPDDLPLWFTETGAIGIGHNTFDMYRQIAWLALLILTGERFGMPKEHIYWFYDFANAGFDNSWLKEPTGDLRPHAVFWRVYSEEVHGKTYDSALDFGPVGNQFYRGNLYAGQSGQTLAIVAQGNPDDTVVLTVSDPGPITYSDWDGTLASADVDLGGNVEIPIDSLPTFVRLSSDCTIAVQDVGGGLKTRSAMNIAPAATATSISRKGTPALVNDGILQTGALSPYLPGGDDLAFCVAQISNTEQPDGIILTWDEAQTIEQVLIRQLPPWTDEIAMTMTQGRLEYLAGGTWVGCPTVAQGHWDDRGNFENATAIADVGQVGQLSYALTFFDQAWCHNVKLTRAIRTTAIRWVMTKGSIGHQPDRLAAAYGYYANYPVYVQCSEILVFGAETVEQGTTFAPVLA
jgi:hypothetical protein